MMKQTIKTSYPFNMEEGDTILLCLRYPEDPPSRSHWHPHSCYSDIGHLETKDVKQLRKVYVKYDSKSADRL